MALNTRILKAKVKKGIGKLPDVVTVFRRGKNQFDEPQGEKVVAKVAGQYYKGAKSRGKNAFTNLKIDEAGVVTLGQAEKFMTVIDEQSANIRVGDCFWFQDRLYEIVDLGNQLDVYYDFSLERKAER